MFRSREKINLNTLELRVKNLELGLNRLIGQYEECSAKFDIILKHLGLDYDDKPRLVEKQKKTSSKLRDF